MDNSINHPDMVSVLAKNGADILLSLTPELCHLMHMTIGISGEAAELLEASLPNPVSKNHIVEELGDLEFYIEGMRQGYGISRSETLYYSPLLDTSDDCTLETSANQIVIEAGKVLDTAKRIFIYCKLGYGRDQLVTDLSRLEYHLAVYRRFLDISYEESLAANIEKLGKRYDGFKYSNEAANARADKSPDDDQPLAVLS